MSMYGTVRTEVHFDEPTLTKQSFKDAVDINRIVASYQRTGLWSSVNGRKPIFADVSKIPDYQSALNVVNAAQSSFMALPSSVRKRFDNDPGKLLVFLSDVKNVDEAVKLGLAVRKEVVKPPAPPAPPAPPVAS